MAWPSRYPPVAESAYAQVGGFHGVIGILDTAAGGGQILGQLEDQVPRLSETEAILVRPKVVAQTMLTLFQRHYQFE